MDKRAKDKLVRSPGENGGGYDAPKDLHSRMLAIIFSSRGQDSAASIATCYRLDGPGIESWWRVRFSAPIQTGPGATQSPIQWIPDLSWG